MKTIKELNCRMEYEWNVVFDAWNGCLVKNNTPNPGSVKTFVRNTQEECLAAATQWANNNTRRLSHPKAEGKIISFQTKEEGMQTLLALCNEQDQQLPIEYALWLKENHTFVCDGRIPWAIVNGAIDETIYSFCNSSVVSKNEYVIGQILTQFESKQMVFKVPLKDETSVEPFPEITCNAAEKHFNVLELFGEESIEASQYISPCLQGHNGRNLGILLKKEASINTQDFYAKFASRIAIIKHIYSCLEQAISTKIIADFNTENITAQSKTTLK